MRTNAKDSELDIRAAKSEKRDLALKAPAVCGFVARISCSLTSAFVSKDFRANERLGVKEKANQGKNDIGIHA